MFALISSRSGSQSAMLLRWALQGHHGPLVFLFFFLFFFLKNKRSLGQVDFVDFYFVLVLGQV